MPNPRSPGFNELDGEEIKAILSRRFHDLLSQVPYLQRHLTLPRLRATVTIRLETYADQPVPEARTIVEEIPFPEHWMPGEGELPSSAETLTSVVNTAPMPGGAPPDQVRDEHDIPIPSPARHQGTPFHYDAVSGREVEGPGGIRIDRTGTGGITDAGMAKMRNATVVTQDMGPAGIRQGGERERLGFKNSSSSNLRDRLQK